MHSDMISQKIEIVESTLGIAFSNKALLLEALTHSSAVNEDPINFPVSNERFEFLGDAFIGFVVANEMHSRLLTMTEGELTEFRSTVVRGASLANLARKWSLGTFLYMGQGEESNGGRERDSNLAAAFEAFIGSLLMDRELSDAYGLTLMFLEDELSKVMEIGVYKDPKSELQKMVQAIHKGLPVYTTVSERESQNGTIFDIQVSIDGEVLGIGSGKRKSDGERQAADQAIRVIRKW